MQQLLQTHTPYQHTPCKYTDTPLSPHTPLSIHIPLSIPHPSLAPHPSQYTSLSQYTHPSLAPPSSQTIASTCWGLSKLKLYDTSVFDAAAGLVVQHIDTFNVIDVSNMMHALARAYTHWSNLAPEGVCMDGWVGVFGLCVCRGGGG